jgi:hypothetical protein
VAVVAMPVLGVMRVTSMGVVNRAPTSAGKGAGRRVFVASQVQRYMDQLQNERDADDRADDRSPVHSRSMNSSPHPGPGRIDLVGSEL